MDFPISDSSEEPGGPTSKFPVEPRHNQQLLDLGHRLWDRILGFLNAQQESELLRRVQAQIRQSVGVISRAVEGYHPEELAVSYNGGKDCLVLLILIIATLSHHSREKVPAKLQAIYVVAPNSFPEVDTFCESSAETYNLDLFRSKLPMKAALAAYIHDQPSLKAIFVGTRRTDPHGAALGHFNETDADKGWPPLMRVHPVIDWHYAEIWAFLRHFEIPYCPLYDMGYTSLGGTVDTRPNPKLKTSDDATESEYRPAYELIDDEEERLGRDA